MSSRSTHGARAMILCLMAAGCVSGGTQVGMQPAFGSASGSRRVMINRNTVTVSAQHTVLEVIEARVPRFRASLDSGAGEPLVVFNGVPLLDGLSKLRSLRAEDVSSIRTLSPIAAAFQYGSSGKNGAIIVTSRTGGA